MPMASRESAFQMDKQSKSEDHRNWSLELGWLDSNFGSATYISLHEIITMIIADVY